MEKRFEYRGDLAVTPLAEILATIHRYRVPGVVRVSREGRQRLIYLDNGLVVFAATNEREESLGAYLLRRRILSPEKGREAARQVREGLRLGKILLRMGVLDEEGLKAAVSGQIRQILWGAFDWESGEVLFDVGERRSEEVIRIDLSIPEVILEGIRRGKDARRFVQRLGHATTILERTPGALISLFALEERAYYERVDGKTALQPLCGKGPGAAAENARVLYAFFCLGLLRKSAAPSPGARKIRYNTGGGTLGD
ncbi:MAG: DUF4388 domain-containing protein [Thermoanaerobaculia bacterium]